MRIIDLYPKDGGEPIRAAVIGTCRLANPLNKLRPIDNAEGEGVKVIWAHSGFAHSIHDAIQWISLIKNKKVAPDGFYQLIFGRTFEESKGDKTDEIFQKGFELLKTCDLLLIELSSNKRVCINEFDFNSNYLTNNFIRPGGLPLLDWWSSICKGVEYTSEQIKETMNEMNSLELYSKKEIKTILSECKVTIDDNQALVQSIKKLSLELKELECVIVVNPDPAYSNISKFLTEESKKSDGFRYLDPNTLIRTYDSSEVFMGKGKDKNHYNEDFNIRVGEHIRDFIFSNNRTDSIF